MSTTRRYPNRTGAGLLVPVLVVLALGAGCATSAASSSELEERLAEGRAQAAETADDQAAAPAEPAEPQRPIVEIPASWPSEIEAVYGRYWLYWDAFAAAHGPPSADPTYEPLRTLSTSGNWASLQEQLTGFADDGLVLDRPPGSRANHLLRMPDTAVLTGDEGEEIVFQDCWIDDFVQRTVDGTEVSRADEARLMNVVMRVIDGAWRVDGVSQASPGSEGVEQCAELID